MNFYLISACYESLERGLWFDNFVVEQDRFPSRKAVQEICESRAYEATFKGISSIIEINLGDARGWIDK